MSEKINIRGIEFDNVTMDEAAARAIEFMSGRDAKVVYTPNSEIAQLCIESEKHMKIINSADMLIPDGSGVVLVSKILKKPLKGKVAGCELAEFLVSYAARANKKIYFLGSKPANENEPSVAEQAAAKLAGKYPGFKVCGFHDGYFKPDDVDSIIDEINSLSPDCVFVCLGAPRQEEWIYENRSRLNAGMLIGLGGSLDVFAGKMKRAPKFFVKLRLEWTYRLLKQPSRIGRMMKIPKFVFGSIFAPKG